MRTYLTAALFAVTLPGLAVSQEPPLPPAERTPVLVLDHAGPHAPVAALAFSPDASTLYVGGYDKLVRRYALVGGKYVARDALRVPLGTGNAGAVNAVAVSPDGKWVAVAGRAPIRGESFSGQVDGVVTRTSTLSPQLKRDFGVVYLFDAANPQQGGKVLRGMESEVRAVAFANPAPAGGHALVTAGIEWDDKGREFGSVRVFDVTTGKEIGEPRRDFPTTTTPPGLGAWAVGEKGLRVAVAWERGEKGKGEQLVVWDAPGGAVQQFAEPLYNGPLAVRVVDGQATALVTAGYREKVGGQLVVRGTDPVGEAQAMNFAAQPRQGVLPLAVAVATGKGAPRTTAALVELSPKNIDTIGRPTELRLFVADKNATVPLTGVSEERLPVLAVSPDGRYAAVGGFADHRVEVYELAALPPKRLEPLPGEPGGFDQVRFLAGNKMWLGRGTDTPQAGGIVLDFEEKARSAKPNDGTGKVDEAAAPLQAIPRNADPANKLPGRVELFANGVRQAEIRLPDGERPTAVAVLAGKPAVVAVAHTNDRAALSLVTLYDAATLKPLLQLGGPALPVRGLTFCGTRPLIAAVGEDRTVFVWSVRDLQPTMPVIEGLVVADDGGAVTVVSAPAGGGLAAGDVIEGVGGAKGELKPIKTPADIVLAVRGLAVGDEARVKVKDKAAPVAVKVVAAVGHRRPLVSAWVDPKAKNGLHDWVAWTQAGPYDTSSDAAEARIGWVTATGNPARPTTFAAAGQYRKDYHRQDLIRFVLEAGDVARGLELRLKHYPLVPPKLAANLTAPVEKLDGRLVTRQKPDGLDVSIDDPDRVFALDTAVLRWRPVGRDGAAGAEQAVPFTGGRTVLDLKAYDWSRGEHQFRVALHLAPDAPAAKEITVSFTHVPPPPSAVALRVNGQEVKHGAELVAKGKEAEVVVSVTAAPGGGPVEVAVFASGVEKPTVVAAGPDGVCPPVKVPLKADGKTVVTARATNRGAEFARLESAPEFQVTLLPPPPPIPPPGVALKLVTPHDPPATPDSPRVTQAPRITLTATVVPAKVGGFEWDLGNGKWVPGELNAAGTQSQELALPTDGNPVTVKVRAKAPGGEAYAEDKVSVVFAAVAEATLKAPPVRSTSPTLGISGTLANPGTVPYTLTAAVRSLKTGEVREVVAKPEVGAKAWSADVTLFPGDNEIGLVVRNKWGESRKPGVARVTYVRPPVVVAVPTLDAGTATVADVLAVVVTHPDVPPNELRVENAPVAFKRVVLPFAPPGAEWSVLAASGVPVKAGDKYLEQVEVAVGNAEADARRGGVKVVWMAPVKVLPPAVVPSAAGRPISPRQTIVTDQPRFRFDVRVLSERPLGRAEVWRGGADGKPELVPGLDPKAAVKAGAGNELAGAVTIDLRKGVNPIKIVAVNAGGETPFEFSVSYTPPPMQVFIDAITEPGPGGKPVELKIVPGVPVAAAGPVLEVRGRVVWDADNDPIARDPNLQAAFHANRVGHLPVRVEEAAAGKKERTFVAPVFLNAKQTNLRVGLQSGGPREAVAQQGYRQAELQIDCKKPLDKQRLHVLVICPEMPQRDRADLARRLVASVGGKVIGDQPGFDRGEFQHPAFARATLYRPLVHDVDQSDIVGLLKEVEREMRQTTGRKGDEWLNDFVWVYYEGRARKDDRRMLHTTRSLVYEGDAATGFMVRVDELLTAAGSEFATVNVAGPVAGQGGVPFAGAVPAVYFGWQKAADRGLLPGLLELAVGQNQRLGDVFEKLATLTTTGLAGPPLGEPPAEEKPRIIGLGNKP